LLTHMSALREFLATDPPSHDASKAICHFCPRPEAGGGLRAAISTNQSLSERERAGGSGCVL
jgi:hypothetical protein